MSTIGSTNITFAELRNKWKVVNFNEGTDPSDTGDTLSNISLSEFRGALFTSGVPVPSGTTDEISINDDFREAGSGRTFASSGAPTYETDSFKVYDTWSAASSFLASYVSNTRAQLNSSNSSYASILFTPNATNTYTSPGMQVCAAGITLADSTTYTGTSKVDEVTLWLEADTESTYSQLGFGILAKDMWKTGSSISGSSYTLEAKKWKEQLAERDNKYATFSDALGFHGYGYHNYAGSRDDITSNTNVSNATPSYNWKSGTYQAGLGPLTTNFHNILGKTGGTVKSSAHNIVSSSYYFFKTHWDNYSGYRGTSNAQGNYGLKIKWYSKTLNVRLTKGSSKIKTQGSNWTNDDDTSTGLEGIFSGMYIEDNSSWPCTNESSSNVFIGKIYLNEITMYQELASSLTEYSASWTGDSTKDVTITISGYLYWTLATTAANSDVKILGPPHTVLPRYQVASGNSTSNPREITEWAFYMNDVTSSSTNTFQYDIMSNDAGTFSYDNIITANAGYAAKPLVYEYAFNNYTSLADPLSGTLSGVSPSYSGISLRDPPYWVNINWYNYSMGHKYKFLVPGKIVAIGSMNRRPARLALFLDGNSSAPAVATGDAWSWAYDTANRYRYVTLSTPRTVTANQEYWVMVKTYSGGYSGHRYSVTPFPAPVKTTTSGNIQFTETGLKNVGRGSNTSSSQASLVQYPSSTTTTSYLYGNTDLIFLPD